MTGLQNPHDRFFKETFTQPHVTRDFATRYLPSEVVQLLDLDTLELQKESFLDEDLEQHFSDLLYRLRLRHGPAAYLYLLFEHKSYPDRLASLQLLRYMVRIWEREVRSSEALLLPMIIPVLLYHGRGAWRFPLDFGSLFDAVEPLAGYVPDFRCQLIDLSQYTDEEIKGQALLSVGLLILKHIFNPDLAQQLPGILALLNELAEQQTGIQYLYTILRYLSVSATTLEAADLQQTVRQLFTEHGEEIMATIAEKWLEQGQQEGWQKGQREGWQKGQQEGWQKGQREGLLAGIELALELKFGLEGLALLPEIAQFRSLPQLQAIFAALRQAGTAAELRQFVRQLVSAGPETS